MTAKDRLDTILENVWHDGQGHTPKGLVAAVQEAKQALNRHYHQKFLEMLPERYKIEERDIRHDLEGYCHDLGYNRAISDMQAKLKLLGGE